MAVDSGELLTLLLGGGAVATIGAFFSGVKSLQTGARAREKETVKGLVRQRNGAWRDLDYANDLVDYWRTRAGTSEFHANQAGATLPEYDPPPVRPPDPAEEDEDS